MNSVHIEDDPIDKYSVPEQQQQHEFETEVVVEETLPAEETSVSFQGAVNNVHETSSVVVDEPVGEPPKKTYASIVCTNSKKFVSFVCVCVCSHDFSYLDLRM